MKVDTLRVDLRLVTPVVVAASKHKLDLLSQLDLRFKFLLGSADQLIAEGTFVVTANTYGPQQVNVVLTTKKGYQKGQTRLGNPCDQIAATNFQLTYPCRHCCICSEHWREV